MRAAAPAATDLVDGDALGLATHPSIYRNGRREADLVGVV